MRAVLAIALAVSGCSASREWPAPNCVIGGRPCRCEGDVFVCGQNGAWAKLDAEPLPGDGESCCGPTWSCEFCEVGG